MRPYKLSTSMPIESIDFYTKKESKTHFYKFNKDQFAHLTFSLGCTYRQHFFKFGFYNSKKYFSSTFHLFPFSNGIVVSHPLLRTYSI